MGKLRQRGGSVGGGLGLWGAILAGICEAAVLPMQRMLADCGRTEALPPSGILHSSLDFKDRGLLKCCFRTCPSRTRLRCLQATAEAVFSCDRVRSGDTASRRCRTDAEFAPPSRLSRRCPLRPARPCRQLSRRLVQALARAQTRRTKSATRRRWSGRIDGCDDIVKFCELSSGCEARPARGEPARAGSEPCDGVGNESGEA